MRTNLHRALGAAGAAAALLAAPAVAGAAVLEPLAPCYSESEAISLRGSGFTANAPVVINVNGLRAAAATADGAGNVVAQALAPAAAKGQDAVQVDMVDQANPANAVGAATLVTDFTVSASPRQARPSSKVTFRARGFPPGRTLYAHYLFNGKGRKTVSLGRLAGPCGTIRRKARQIPVRKIRIGLWTVQFDVAKRYSKSSRPSTRVQIQVFRTLRPR